MRMMQEKLLAYTDKLGLQLKAKNPLDQGTWIIL